MGEALLKKPAQFLFELREADSDFWNSLLSGVAIGTFFFCIVFSITSSQNPLPWGRFKSRATPLWGPAVPMWVAWMVQEMPSALIPSAVLLWSQFCQGRPFNLIVLLAFAAHYIYRTFIYSLRHYRLPQGRRRDTVPLLVPVSAFMFCFINGLAQSLSGCQSNYSSEFRGLRYFFPRKIPLDEEGVEMLRKTSLWDILALLRFNAGMAFFVYGMLVNIISDEHLLQLKTRALESTSHSLPTSPRSQEPIVTLRRSSRLAAKKGDDIVTFKYHVQPQGFGVSAYKIPRLGWFQEVSCANYWGEICEWFGYAIMCNSMVSLTFAIFTVVFLGCRGVQTHRWYKSRFGANYPKNRYAVIPYVL